MWSQVASTLVSGYPFKRSHHYATMPKEVAKCSKYLVTTRQNEKRKRRNLIIYFMVKAPCYKDFLEGIIKKWDSENLTSFLIRYNHIYLKWRNYKLCAALLCWSLSPKKQNKCSFHWIKEHILPYSLFGIVWNMTS